ncbi:MAG: winged helix-turn-helix domain-containing protein [Plesiomonas sp.]|uniref:winged helix-turn-helix domain-containing protein n=1 Tax=Plesiomonas sp. TaxID=2486279 RepID=UPI003F3B82B2
MLELNITSGELKWLSKKIAQLNKSECLVLAYLLKNTNRFSSKDDLLCEGWPARVVSPNSLAVAIKNIRRSLSKITQEFSIETNHGRGYTLHGDVNKFTILSAEPHYSKDNKTYHAEPLYEESPANTQNRSTYSEDAEKNNIDKNHHEINPSNKIASNIKKILIATYVISILYLALIFKQNSGELYCYKISNTTTACGVFYLNELNIESLKLLLQDKDGDYFYGQKNNSPDFKVYNNN